MKDRLDVGRGLAELKYLGVKRGECVHVEFVGWETKSMEGLMTGVYLGRHDTPPTHGCSPTRLLRKAEVVFVPKRGDGALNSA